MACDRELEYYGKGCSMHRVDLYAASPRAGISFHIFQLLPVCDIDHSSGEWALLVAIPRSRCFGHCIHCRVDKVRLHDV